MSTLKIIFEKQYIILLCIFMKDSYLVQRIQMTIRLFMVYSLQIQMLLGTMMIAI